jgi:hypothetical protein
MIFKNQIQITEELCILLDSNKNKTVEASLLLNYGGMATHFLSKSKSYIFDEGIDSQLTKWSKDEFIANYKNGHWIVNQIV